MRYSRHSTWPYDKFDAWAAKYFVYDVYDSKKESVFDLQTVR
jgi:hypothetical protein